MFCKRGSRRTIRLSRAKEIIFKILSIEAAIISGCFAEIVFGKVVGEVAAIYFLLFCTIFALSSGKTVEI